VNTKHHIQPDTTHRITRLEALAYVLVALLTLAASAAQPWGFALPL
jgi:hypothetical protein